MVSRELCVCALAFMSILEKKKETAAENCVASLTDHHVFFCYELYTRIIDFWAFHLDFQYREYQHTSVLTLVEYVQKMKNNEVHILRRNTAINNKLGAFHIVKYHFT